MLLCQLIFPAIMQLFSSWNIIIQSQEFINVEGLLKLSRSVAKPRSWTKVTSSSGSSVSSSSKGHTPALAKHFTTVLLLTAETADAAHWQASGTLTDFWTSTTDDAVSILARAQLGSFLL